MRDPVEFLTKALAEAQARAQAAAEVGRETRPVWRVATRVGDHYNIPIVTAEDGEFPRSAVAEGDPYGGDGDRLEHIAAFDPATVLRMVAGAEKVMELHLPYLRYVGMDKSRWVLIHGAEAVEMARQSDQIWKTDGLECEACGDFEGGGEHPRLPWPCPTIKALAEMWGWTGA
jgi:hypothetical protein